MNTILKYHLQDANTLIHRGKGKVVVAVPQYIQCYGMHQCYSKQLWDQAMEMGLMLALCYISEIFSTLLYQPHSPTHWTEVSNLTLISTLRQHHMRVHMVFQYFNFLHFKHLPSLSTCGDTKPQGNYTIKYLHVSVGRRKCATFSSAVK